MHVSIFVPFLTFVQFRARNVAEFCYYKGSTVVTFFMSAAVTLPFCNAANCSAPPDVPLPQAVIKALIDWTRALRDISLLPEALEQAMSLSRAEAVVLARHDNRSNIAQTAATCDRSGLKRDLPRLARSCAPDFLGKHINAARPGSLWLLSQLDRQPGAGHWISAWCRDRQVTEIAVMVLASDDRQSDFLEMHFRTPLTAVSAETLRVLAQAMAYAWMQRNEAYVMQLVLKARNHETVSRQETSRTILDTSNPFRLSRAEFRICMLAGRGMHAKQIAQNLSLQESTVRCHLRSIYKKTGATSQINLMYRLHGAPTSPDGARQTAQGY